MWLSERDGGGHVLVQDKLNTKIGICVGGNGIDSLVSHTKGLKKGK
jgi:hypothetical protein